MEEIEYECYECGNKWTRSDGRGCPYGDPNCFLCEKHDHSDCDDPREPCDLCNQHSCERTIDDEEECEHPELWDDEEITEHACKGRKRVRNYSKDEMDMQSCKVHTRYD